MRTNAGTCDSQTQSIGGVNKNSESLAETSRQEGCLHTALYVNPSLYVIVQVAVYIFSVDGSMM